MHVIPTTRPASQPAADFPTTNSPEVRRQTLHAAAFVCDSGRPAAEQLGARAWGETHGLTFGGTVEGHYLFVRERVIPQRPVPGNPGTFFVREVVYAEFLFTPRDIADGSADVMLRHGGTREVAK